MTVCYVLNYSSITDTENLLQHTLERANVIILRKSRSFQSNPKQLF